MAFLYIDRLKSNFQQADHPLPRAYARENWFPRFFVRCFSNGAGKECCARGKSQVKSGYTHFRVPKEPKICAIGLHSNRGNVDEGKPPFWSLMEVKKLVQQYLNVVRRYRSYFYISWKPVPSENCENETFSFTSFISIVSKCSKKFTKREWFVNKDGETQCYEYQRSSPETCNFESPLKNSCNSNSANNQCFDDNVNHQNTKKKTYSDSPIVSSKKNENSRTPSNFVQEKPLNRTVLTVESNDSTVLRSNNCSVGKSKRNVCVQTSRKHNSHKKSSKNVKNSEKENFVIPTKASSSKDVKTIFKVNDADFNDRKSKTNLKELNARQKTKKTSNSKTKNKVKKLKEDTPKYSSKNECNTHSIMSFNEESQSPNFEKDLGSKRRRRNVNKFQNRTQTSLTSNINSMRTSKATVCKTPQSRNSRSYSTTDSPKITSTKWTPERYLVENKISEIMILGNIKKRLEEDYDEYFSVNENDFENDVVDPGTPGRAFQTNRRSAASSETRINQCASRESVKTSRSMLMTVAKYQESQNHVWHSTLESVGQEESQTRSIGASLMYNCASCCSNLDLVRSQSSYYHSLREDECSPSSSIEYCTASSISLSKFHSSLDNSFDAMLQTYSVDNDAPYDCNFNPSSEEGFLSNEVSFEDNEIEQDDKEFADNAKEFLDETVVDSFTVCCCQKNSTPKLSDSSKRVTESLDSGILTDFSRECLRASEELLKEKRETNLEKRECDERKVDLPLTYDFDTDSSCSDDSLDRRVDIAVKKFTENLILTERKVKIKLRRLQNPVKRRKEKKRRKSGRQMKKIESTPKYGSTCELDSPQCQNDDDRFLSSSTPPVFSFSDSEMDHL